MKNNSNGGGFVATCLIVFAIIAFIGVIAMANNSNSSATKTNSSTSTPTTNYQPKSNKTPAITPVPVTPKEEPETWTCYDATSYDKNSNNDNRCVSNKGTTRYVSDCEAVKLDPDYCPPQIGPSYYNGCGCSVY